MKQDVVVFGALATWWLLAPLQDDDGWVRARQTNSTASGGFSNYYEHWGADLPLATWLEWLQHFVIVNTSAIAIHRLPSVIALLATWVVCRASLTRLFEFSVGSRNLGLWAAAAAFALGSVAFGGTLRPEPAIALLATSVLACCLRYVANPSLGPLFLAVLLVGLAVTVHPSGAVSIAPLALCIPRFVRDARARVVVDPLGLASVSAVGIAWTLLLAFVDSDTDARNESVRLIRVGGGHGEGVFQELHRYLRLSDPGASPARRLFVALLLLLVGFAILSFVRKRDLGERLPAASVGLGLLLLSINPSKWIWHFGVFVGLCAVAIGFEMSWLSRAGIRRELRIGFALVVLTLAVWATSQTNTWGPLDMGRLNLNRLPGPFMTIVCVVAIAIVLAGVLGLVRRAHVIILPALVTSVAALTITLFAVDAFATSGWTTGRQTVASVVGHDGCGVASDLVVAVPALQANIAPARLNARKSSTWYPVSMNPVGFFISGSMSHGERVVVSWGRRTERGVVHLGSGAVDLRQADPGPDLARWRFVAQDSLPRRPHEANRLRVSLVRGVGGSRATVTAPVVYSNVLLSSMLSGRATLSLVSPYLFEAMPCARLPRLAYGVAATPDVLVDWVAVPALTNFSSPFQGLPDVLDLMRLPVRSRFDRGSVYVYVVRPNRRDAIAPAVMRVVT
jgi:hypothetical protein